MPSRTYRSGKRLWTTVGYTYDQQAPVNTTVTQTPAWSNVVNFGENIPDWRRRIAGLKTATTTLGASRAVIKANPGFYSYTYWNGTYKRIETYRHSGMMGYYPSLPNASSLSTAKADNLAKVRFVKRAQEVSRAFQGSIALGELAETLRMIKNPAKAFREGLDKYMQHVKKRAVSRRQPNSRPMSAKALRHMIADTWLEHAFGWAPLLSDVRSAAEALARRRHELRRETVRVVAGGSDVSSLVEAPRQCVYQFLVSYYYPRTISEVHVKYYGIVKREVFNDYAFDLNLFGFNPREFLPTVWELIPYSFLVDYFTNIGDIINAYSFNRSSLAWCNRGMRRIAVLSAKSWLDGNYARRSVESSSINKWLGDVRVDPSYELKHVLVNRDPYTGSFVPSIEFEIPGLGTKWINLAALAAGHADARRAISRRG